MSNAKVKLNGEANPTKNDQSHKESINATVHHSVHAESINLHEAQGSRNNFMPSYSETNDSAAPPIDSVPEKNMMLSLYQIHPTIHISLMSLESVQEKEYKNCPGDKMIH